MTAYPDTSFLCALYRSQDNSPVATAHAARMKEPVHVAGPLLYEFRQSTRLQVFLYEKDPKLGFPRSTAQIILAKLQANIASGGVVIVPVDWGDVFSIAERLSAQFAIDQGYRGLDILHVATAIHLGTAEFLTFDGKQKRLAEAEGLTVPF